MRKLIINNSYQQKYYLSNRERLLEKQKKYYENNKNELLERTKNYYENKKMFISEMHKNYYENNKNEIRIRHKINFFKKYYDLYQYDDNYISELYQMKINLKNKVDFILTVKELMDISI